MFDAATAAVHFSIGKRTNTRHYFQVLLPNTKMLLFSFSMVQQSTTTGNRQSDMESLPGSALYYCCSYVLSTVTWPSHPLSSVHSEISTVSKHQLGGCCCVFVKFLSTVELRLQVVHGIFIRFSMQLCMLIMLFFSAVAPAAAWSTLVNLMSPTGTLDLPTSRCTQLCTAYCVISLNHEKTSLNNQFGQRGFQPT